MAAYPLSDIRPASAAQIRSTISVVPRCVPMGSITTIASLASTRLESISMEKPRAERNCSVRPRGAWASISRARRCSRPKRDAEEVEVRRVRRFLPLFWSLLSPQERLRPPARTTRTKTGRRASDRSGCWSCTRTRAGPDRTSGMDPKRSETRLWPGPGEPLPGMPAGGRRRDVSAD
jgi:hypothetical protein